MTNLLWPGDHRAGSLMTDSAMLDAMVAVETAWLHALSAHGLVPKELHEIDLRGLLSADTSAQLADRAEAAGNPVVELVALLRERAPEHARRWIHRGLTSQDVIDTALSMLIRAAVDELLGQLLQQISTLAALAETHRRTPMVARTLTQHAIPITFGVKVSVWLGVIVDGYGKLNSVSTPVQIGGAAGTLAASTELARLQGTRGDAPTISVALVHDLADSVGLSFSPPWHTARSAVTDAADALVGCSDAWGRIATDVVTLSRPEIGEVTESTTVGRGGSSTMPQKRNPVLSILIRRAAITAPALAASLHASAALANDERPDGAWHAEWDTIRTLARRTLVAGSQCTELLRDIQVHPVRMAQQLADDAVLAEQRSIAQLVGAPPSQTYLGAAEVLIDAAINRATHVLRDKS
ncbi:lyase family protein [Mycobacterium sp. 1245852.3]|uniref:lyase family protein n=1 Tax=Mycobacterium sp. 1245852.3 TaxID=1856860 RepID=UPI0007FC609E|nr:lyase family protein [Mycobacterium sp. 1245852.3]OBJ83303.1 3-carboxy-cis,cis-muconate cycloisomerase [Mycobacterium sp. 1245852.3]